MDNIKQYKSIKRNVIYTGRHRELTEKNQPCEKSQGVCEKSQGGYVKNHKHNNTRE